MTEQELIDFEEDIAKIYAEGQIRAPIHLSGGNFKQLIDIFKEIRPQDYFYSNWRNHGHALCKGVPRELVKKKILNGHSINLCFPQYNFYSSAIVGGAVPIAVGTAWALKKQNKDARVYCAVGDMSAFCGITLESYRYAVSFDLPFTLIVEDNEKSVGTPTKEATGMSCQRLLSMYEAVAPVSNSQFPYLRYYKYTLDKPHAGCGVFIQF